MNRNKLVSPRADHQRSASAGLVPPAPAAVGNVQDGQRGRPAGKLTVNTRGHPHPNRPGLPPPVQGPRPAAPPNTLAPSPHTGRSTSQPPLVPNVRAVSAPQQSPQQLKATQNIIVDDSPQKLQRKSWFPGLGGKSKAAPLRAWVAGHEGKLAYNIQPLVSASPVAELWDESGDTFVYLYPRTSGRGPSFKVQSALFSSSTVFTKMAFGEVYSRRKHVPNPSRRQTSDSVQPTLPQLSMGGAPPSTPPMTPKGAAADGSSTSPSSSRGTRATEDSFDDAPRQVHLYIPSSLNADAAFPDRGGSVSDAELDTLISIRNLFAFLQGQSIVATDRRPRVFSIFMKMADLLKTYDFANFDRTTFGEVASTSFEAYVDELGLADVRPSREKTMEALVLAEKMRCVTLYNEAFVHAVGRYDDILALSKLDADSAAKFNLVSPTTRSRLERASIDLVHREKSINLRLSEFEFPSLFAGVLASKSLDERKMIQFSAWKESFLAMRRHVLSYYKAKFGTWPPRAQSKKNDFEIGGLNRVLLRVLYRDFSDTYDLYVDRRNLTTRSSDPHAATPEVQQTGWRVNDTPEEAAIRILRRMFDEFDRSSPPVQPPVPYDVPILPGPSHLRRKSGSSAPLSSSDLYRLRQKKLKEDDATHLLLDTTNADMHAKFRTSPFLDSVRAFECKEGRGKTPAQLVDLRAGMWIFTYVVLQSLPMLVVDAPGLRFRDGVEYFLCMPPRSGVPWAGAAAGGAAAATATGAEGVSAARGKTAWYGVAGGHGVVNLPSDLVEHGVEGVYRRSHCWLAAASNWNRGAASASAPGSAAASGNASARASFERDGAIPPYLLHQQHQQPHQQMQLQQQMQILQMRQAEALAPPPPLDPDGYMAQPASPRSGSAPVSRSSSPGSAARARLSAHDSVVALGLEQLPVPAGVSPVAGPQHGASFPVASRGHGHGAGAGVGASGHPGAGAVEAGSSGAGGGAGNRSRPTSSHGYGAALTPSVSAGYGAALTPSVSAGDSGASAGPSAGPSAGSKGMTFDDILADLNRGKDKGKKQKAGK